MAGRKATTKGRGRRITEFFDAKKRVGVEGIIEEQVVDEPPAATHILAREADHPFFTTQAKRVKEAEEARNAAAMEGWQVWRVGDCEAPLHPSSEFIMCSGRLFTCDDRDRGVTPRLVGLHTDTVLCKWESVEADLDRIPDRAPSWEPPLADSRPCDGKLFKSRLDEILSWIRPGSMLELFADPGELEDEPFKFPKQTQFNPTQQEDPLRRPIIFINGPNASGKSEMAQALADHLHVPLTVIDGAVTVRTGKPFDDILSASHNQRKVMKQFFAAPPSNSLTVNVDDCTDASLPSSSIKLVVLVDEVDLVFDIDRFYNALNAFLRNVPRSILVVLTFNIDPDIMCHFIDLPAGSLRISMGDLHSKMHLSSLNDFSLGQQMQHSDLAVLSDGIRRELVEYDPASLPLYCWPYDTQDGRDPILEYISLTWGSPPLSAPALSRDALLRDLQREGWMMSCRGPVEWVSEYRSAWRVLENDAASRQDARLRRTPRAIAARTYLMGIPLKFIQRLRGLEP